MSFDLEDFRKKNYLVFLLIFFTIVTLFIVFLYFFKKVFKIEGMITQKLRPQTLNDPAVAAQQKYNQDQYKQQLAINKSLSSYGGHEGFGNVKTAAPHAPTTKAAINPIPSTRNPQPFSNEVYTPFK